MKKDLYFFQLHYIVIYFFFKISVFFFEDGDFLSLEKEDKQFKKTFVNFLIYFFLI